MSVSKLQNYDIIEMYSCMYKLWYMQIIIVGV